MIVYKIRRKSDGLFSTGGTTPKFTSKGKTWSGLGQIKNHLNQFIEIGWSFDPKITTRFYPYSDCELVEFVISETESGTEDLRKMMNEALDRQSKKYYNVNKLVIHV